VRARNRVDIVVTVVLLVALVFFGMLVSSFGRELPVAAAASGTCSEGCGALVTTLAAVGAVGVWVVAVIGGVLTAVLVWRGTIAFWVPLAAAAVMVCLVVAAYAIVVVSQSA
jgi:hypothetical protein